MKKLNKILLMIIALSVATIYGQASDNYQSSITKNEYKITVKSDNKITKGENKINVKITHKGHVVQNAKVLFSVYQSDDNVIEYQSNTTDTNGNHVFTVKLPENGESSYTVSFNRNGGVIRQLRGTLKI